MLRINIKAFSRSLVSLKIETNTEAKKGLTEMTMDISAKIYIVLALFIFIIPLVTTLPIVMIVANQLTKPIAIGLITILSVIYIGLALSIGKNEIQNNQGTLEFKAGLYHYSLSPTELEHAVVSFTTRKSLGEKAIKIRVNGIGLFGYNVG